MKSNSATKQQASHSQAKNRSVRQMNSNRSDDRQTAQLREIANSATKNSQAANSSAHRSGPVIQMVKRAELEAQARKAADDNASSLQALKTGHGRKTHGKDASGKAKKYANPRNLANNTQAVWQQIYDQTLSRLLKQHKKDLED